MAEAPSWFVILKTSIEIILENITEISLPEADAGPTGGFFTAHH